MTNTKGLETRWRIYKALCKMKEASTYELAVIMGLSSGGVDKALKKMECDGLIISKLTADGPRMKRIWRPATEEELEGETVVEAKKVPVPA